MIRRASNRLRYFANYVDFIAAFPLHWLAPLRILLNPRCHFDLVRAGSALFGTNPTPGSANPMLPVVELRARIVQVRDVTPGENIADEEGWFAKRRRVAFVSLGYADGLPRSWHPKISCTPWLAGTAAP